MGEFVRFEKLVTDDNPDALRKHRLSPWFWLSNVLLNNEMTGMWYF